MVQPKRTLAEFKMLTEMEATGTVTAAVGKAMPAMKAMKAVLMPLVLPHEQLPLKLRCGKWPLRTKLCGRTCAALVPLLLVLPPPPQLKQQLQRSQQQRKHQHRLLFCRALPSMHLAVIRALSSLLTYSCLNFDRIS
jgi:hypothetical protein